MRPFKRFFAILLCVSLLIPAFSTETFAASEDYRRWSQSDSLWGGLVMGSNQEATVSYCGCTSVAMTKLLRQSGAVGKGYTPRDFVNHMNTIGAYSSKGTISWSKAEKAGIGLSFQKVLEYSSTSSAVNNAISYVEKGYYVIVKGMTKWDDYVDYARSLANVESPLKEEKKR